jgi:hypothetical protein
MKLLFVVGGLLAAQPTNGGVIRPDGDHKGPYRETEIREGEKNTTEQHGCCIFCAGCNLRLMIDARVMRIIADSPFIWTIDNDLIIIDDS